MEEHSTPNWASQEVNTQDSNLNEKLKKLHLESRDAIRITRAKNYGYESKPVKRRKKAERAWRRRIVRRRNSF